MTDRLKSDVLFSPLVRGLGFLWVAVSLPFITIVSALAQTADTYVFVLIYLACGAYTAPALVVGWFAFMRAPSRDRTAYVLLYAGLVVSFLIGVAMLTGVATGWTWGNALGVPAVALSGLAHAVGVATLVRSRSGRRALSVDVIESIMATVAVAAPLVVLWWPAIVDADAAWFTVPCAVALVFAITGTYWAAMLGLRLGPGRGLFETCALALGVVGTVNVALQIVYGVSSFTLPAPPFVFLTGLCMSQYLLIPLNVPLLLRQGLGRLPLTAQVRGGSLSTVFALTGLAALLVATAGVADERSWAVPFALTVVSLMFVLAGLRQIAAVGETRRLYRQVEQASDERQRLMTQLLDRSLHDRHNFAAQLYEQAVAAYTSFSLLAGAGAGSGAGEASAEAGSAVAKASAMVGGDLARHAESVRELVHAIRPNGGNGGGSRSERLGIPVRAYLATIYGDHPAPRLSLEMTDDLALDWISETVLLQIAQEAMHNVWRHSNATRVDVVIEADKDSIAMCVADDGTGFDLASVPEGSGIAVMRASAAAVGGTLVVDSHLGIGTAVTARLVPGGGEAPRPRPEPTQPRTLRLVRDSDSDGDGDGDA